MEDFVARLVNTTKPIVAPKCQEVEYDLIKVNGFIDVDEKEEEIKNSLQETLSENEQIQGIDQALKQFAIDHNLAPAED